MKKIIYFFVFTLLTFSYSPLALEVTEFMIKPTGRIVILNEKEEFSKNCRSTRSWPQISGLSSKTVENSLNRKFKKILSIGRKLKESDCPSSTSNEYYLYSNNVSIGSQKGNFLGIKFLIVFPGGSMRALRDCRIFDLTNGKEVNLKKLLSFDAFKNGQLIWKERFPGQVISEFEPEGLNPNISNNYSSLCLEADGLYLYKDFNAKWDGVLLKAADQNKIFKPSPIIDIIMEK